MSEKFAPTTKTLVRLPTASGHPELRPEPLPAWRKKLCVDKKNLRPGAPPYDYVLPPIAVPHTAPEDYGLNVEYIIDLFCETRKYLNHRIEWEYETRSTALWKRLRGDMATDWMRFDDVGKGRPGTIRFLYDGLLWVQEALEKDAKGEFVGRRLTKEEKEEAKRKEEKIKMEIEKKMARMFKKEARKVGGIKKSTSARFFGRLGIKID